MVEAMGAVLFLYRPVAWCFLRGMKKYNALIISIVAAVVILASIFIPWGKFWWTEVAYYESSGVRGYGQVSEQSQTKQKRWETPYRFFNKHGTEIGYY